MLFTQRLGIMKGWGAMWIALAVLLLGGSALSQTQSQETSTICIQNPVLEPGGAGAAGPIGLRVSWRVGCDSRGTPAVTYDSFVVWRADLASFEKIADSAVETREHYHVFKGIDTTKQHFFKVHAYLNGGHAKSTGAVEWRPTIGDVSTPISLGYWFLWFLEKVGIMGVEGMQAWRDSSTMGQWAFSLIGGFFILGVFVWLCRTLWALRSSRIFLVDKEIGGNNECDVAMSQPELLSLSPDQADAVRELVKTRLTRGHFLGKLRWLDKYSPFERTVRKRSKDATAFRNNPSVRILLSAATSLQQPGEIEKALEVRILAEEEELLKRSFVDALWATGVTAPLVGLFGTVTGISMSFREIMERSLQGEDLLKALAMGIYEALYTTICGLIVGILFMLAYYWYNHKMERIHAIWVVFASEFVDKLKHGVGLKNVPAPKPAGEPKK